MHILATLMKPYYNLLPFKISDPTIITDAGSVEINPCSFINLNLYAQTQVFSPVLDLTPVVQYNANNNEKEITKRVIKLQKVTNTILLLTTQLILKQWLVPPGQIPPVSILEIMFCAMEYPFG